MPAVPGSSRGEGVKVISAVRMLPDESMDGRVLLVAISRASLNLRHSRVNNTDISLSLSSPDRESPPLPRPVMTRSILSSSTGPKTIAGRTPPPPLPSGFALRRAKMLPFSARGKFSLGLLLGLDGFRSGCLQSI